MKQLVGLLHKTRSLVRLSCARWALTMPRRRGAAPGLGRSRSTGKASHDGRVNAPRDTRASAPISVPRPPRRAGRFTLLVFFFREMPPKPFPGSRSQPAVCTSTSVTAAETEPYSRARTAGVSPWRLLVARQRTRCIWGRSFRTREEEAPAPQIQEAQWGPGNI